MGPRLSLDAPIISVKQLINRVRWLDEEDWQNDASLTTERQMLQDILDEIKLTDGPLAYLDGFYPLELIQEANFVDYIEEKNRDPNTKWPIQSTNWDRISAELRLNDYGAVLINNICYWYLL